jgi:hypothetical protein
MDGLAMRLLALEVLYKHGGYHVPLSVPWTAYPHTFKVPTRALCTRRYLTNPISPSPALLLFSGSFPPPQTPYGRTNQISLFEAGLGAARPAPVPPSRITTRSSLSGPSRQSARVAQPHHHTMPALGGEIADSDAGAGAGGGKHVGVEHGP